MFSVNKILLTSFIIQVNNSNLRKGQQDSKTSIDAYTNHRLKWKGTILFAHAFLNTCNFILALSLTVYKEQPDLGLHCLPKLSVRYLEFEIQIVP